MEKNMRGTVAKKINKKARIMWQEEAFTTKRSIRQIKKQLKREYYA